MSEPQRFGDYLLLDRIAQGGMAELFLAKRTGVEGFEKTLAIKRILPELSSHREFVSMFINEAKIAARLSHPNIAQIFDFGKVSDYYFIAMEYVHGENLRTILQRAQEAGLPFPQDLAALVIARTCAALEHAHRKTDERGNPLHIIHRDVSPQNVLVSYEGETKVVDFGIAKAIAENPEATKGVIKGKLAYLSPEQVTGKNLDGRSDVFAVGTVLYELLAGRRLFEQSTSGEVLDAIVRIDPAAVERQLPNVHRRLREVVRRSLQPDRDKRYRSAGEMQQALEDFLRERGDPGGTLHLASYMRVLFDDKIGTGTLERLRSEVLGRETAATQRGRTWPAVSPRILAALAGAALGVVALVVAAPEPRLENPPSPEAPKEPSGPIASAPKPEEAPPAPPARGRAEIERGAKALAAGRPAEAVEALEAAFALDPDLREEHAQTYARALSEDGKRLFEEGSDRAGARFEAAAEADPGLFDPHFYLAKIHTRRSSPDQAIREYGEAIRIDPASADAQFNLGFLYFSLRRYEDALSQYQKVLELRPPYLMDVFYNVSACYERMGRKPDAIAALRRGLEVDPQSELLRQRLKQLGG
ncbi:MAG: protein kinase domain-containing protein [Candidatus Binatia bacterium]